ncbi:unnamed protein product [Kuraishia capsulata CBS 1993]|uniref:Heat shock transcription factor n=1 Tax=Kuraishia capsulata CBS 1993 TaxID=1382522 RepID=W6MPX9_9ASCO|nr:uncharacterized protein KUCA_T00004695001 [Kuraishia capsulata CBS 1993]CDK28711.1 unnamed protein product [Kuraishia capsulata CBS 1993]
MSLRFQDFVVPTPFLPKRKFALRTSGNLNSKQETGDTDDGIEEIVREDRLPLYPNLVGNSQTFETEQPEMSSGDIPVDPFPSVLFSDPPAVDGAHDALTGFPNDVIPNGFTDGLTADDVINNNPQALTTYSNGLLHGVDPLYSNNITEIPARLQTVNKDGRLSPIQGTSEERTYFKRPKPKRLTNGTNKRPAFVTKLWDMVNDEKNNDYIRWMPDGKSFQVLSRETFLKDVLPKYFKHKNFASFVRQLNMYGWHKVQDVSSGSMNNEELWQFENPCFLRGREDLLDSIVRNRAKPEEDEELDIQVLLSELETIKSNQRLIADDLRRVKHDNETLWKENFIARERHKNQSETLDKILMFLASVYGTSKNDIQNITGSQEPVAHEHKPVPAQSFNNRPMLMIAPNAHKRTPSESNAPAASGISEISKTPNSVGESPIQEIYRGPELKQGLPYVPDSIDPATNPYRNLSLQSDAAAGRALFPEFADSIQSPAKNVTDLDIPYSSQGGSKYHRDSLRGLENTIAKQGDSIKHVQDWISKLHRNFNSADRDYNEASSRVSDSASRLDDNFDVDDYLNSGTPLGIEEIDNDSDSDDDSPGAEAGASAQDPRIDEIFDDKSVSADSNTSTDWMSGSKRANPVSKTGTPPKRQHRKTRS